MNEMLNLPKYSSHKHLKLFNHWVYGIPPQCIRLFENDFGIRLISNTVSIEAQHRRLNRDS